MYGGVALSESWPHAFRVRGSDRPELLPEGLHQVTSRLWAAVHRDRASCGTSRRQLCSLSKATELLRRITAGEPRPLGGCDAGKLETERVFWALIRVAVDGVGGAAPTPKGMLQLRRAVADALGITLPKVGPPAWAQSRTRALSHGDVWASATGVPGFGEAVERLVDPDSRLLPETTASTGELESMHAWNQVEFDKDADGKSLAAWATDPAKNPEFEASYVPPPPEMMVRTDKKHSAALWASPVGKTLARRTCAVRIERGSVVVDPAFLKPSVALAWATERCLGIVKRVSDALDACTAEADVAAMVAGAGKPILRHVQGVSAGDAWSTRVLHPCEFKADEDVDPDFRHDGTTKRLWKMLEARRVAAKQMLADALGISVHFEKVVAAASPRPETESVKDCDIAWAPCLRQLQSPEPPLYEFMNDLRVTTAVVVEDFARLLGRHAADVFGGDSAMLGGMLGATWERSSDERKSEFRRILKRFRSRPLAGGQLCSVIRRRTEVGKPGFHCPAASCAECHEAAGLTDDAATAAATPGMVTLALTRKSKLK